jgi:hypothetical protein
MSMDKIIKHDCSIKIGEKLKVFNPLIVIILSRRVKSFSIIDFLLF